MRFHLDDYSSVPLRKQIRDQLYLYIHLGVLQPGNRLPTVRELALDAGVNLKTAFRIYRELAREDLVEIRPQSGVFVKSSGWKAERSFQKEFKAFLQRVLREAEQFNLSPYRVAQLVRAEAGKQGQKRVRCAVLECNREQTHLFSDELRRKLGLDAFPVSTNGGARVRERALKRADVFVTTDFHWREVSQWAARHHREAYRIRLNPAFLQMLIRNARRGLFPMIVTDVSFEAAFRKVLVSQVTSEVSARLVVVHYRDKRLRALYRHARRAYSSPLCFAQVVKSAPRSVRILTMRDMISRESLRTLRQNLCV